MSLDHQVNNLSSIFKSNLGTFLSRALQQANSENSNTDIESLLTDLDRVISNQKELSELIQKVKLHQKINKELESTNENIKNTQNSILSLIEELRKKDLDLAEKVLKAQELKNNLKALNHITQDPETTILSAFNLAITTGAPFGWNPSVPLLNNRPPYPTEDLIRRSLLYQMMTQSVSEDVEKLPASEETVEFETAVPSAPVRTRRKGAVNGDKSKLLDLDLNPDI